MSSSPSAAPLLPPTWEQHGDVFRTIYEVAQKTSDATAEPLKNHEPMTEVIDYEALKTQHAELLEQGKTSTEIAVWLGNKLNISAWKAWRFHGERKVLSTPTEEEMTRLKAFTQTLGVEWRKTNIGSHNHPEFLLLDGYNVSSALFGRANMQKVNAQLDVFVADWEKMWVDPSARAKYLLDQIGLDIKNDWSSFPGYYTGKEFSASHQLHVSGGIGHGNCVYRMWISADDSSPHGNCWLRFLLPEYASYGRLCFLA